MNPPAWTVETLPPWRLWLDPRGRVGRGVFWRYGVLSLFGLGLLLRALADIAGLPEAASDPGVTVLLAWPTLAISIKRWHDRGRSGRWALLLALPATGVPWLALIGGLWLVLDNGFVRGDRGGNRYGPPPGIVNRF
jgi:uncharacterized membrane protein YhaH (DUF805 family)